MKLIVSAGGTGGHIYPALAIINKFREKEPNLEVLYIGTHNRMEKDIIPKYNIKYEELEIYGLNKGYFIRNIKNINYLRKAYHKCLKIMKEFKPDLVIGVGGYVTMPVILASSHLKIKTIIHEQNSIPGKTNKILSKKANIVFTSFKDTKDYFAKKVKVVYSGNPSADNVINLKPMTKKDVGFNDNPLVLITMGSLGSMSVNKKLEEFLKLANNASFNVLFITGKDNYDEFIKNKKYSKNIKIIPYLDNLSSLLKSCDLVISRAGASIISEILMASIPSILIPSPNVANNHQYYNAKSLYDNGLALMIEEDKLDSKKLYSDLKMLIKGNTIYKNIQNNLNKYEKNSASEIIYNKVKELIK